MKLLKKPIFTGFAPNITRQDTYTACSFLCLPWKWGCIRKGKNVVKVEKWLQDYFNTKHGFCFDSGRTALHYALKALEVKEEDEILVQAYTCVVVSNAINWTGAKPIYVDVDNDFNMSPDDLIRKITDKSKVLIIQHTFGKPANLDKLVKIAKEHNIKIIEDCAHSLGAKYKEKLTGTFGDIGMFSFGTDKTISCVRGGGLITNNDSIGNRIREFQSRLPLSRKIKVIQNLLHYPVFSIGKPLYNLGIGKLILMIAKTSHIMSKIIYNPEKHGKQVLFYPSLLPNALAKILLNQIKSLEKVNKHRQEIAKTYDNKIETKEIIKPEWGNESVWLRYTIVTDKAKKLHQQCKKQGIILGNWYDSVIAPCDIEKKQTGYSASSCPNAEKLAKGSINLPTNRHVSTKDAERIVQIVNKLN